jgi:small subunit ribosomal protein S7e
MAAGLGPQPAPERSVDEVLAQFNDVPLFMKSLEGDESENPALAALQNLAYEGTPDGG